MSMIPGPTGTVVVGCDSSWASQNAVIAAARQAALRGTTLVLLAVVERRPYWPDRFSWVAGEAGSAREARAAIDLAMAMVVAAGPSIAVQTVIVNALESCELADVAGKTGLLVLGRRGDGGQLAFSLGSTSWELARRFHCPILVVHDHLRTCDRQHVGPDRAVIAVMDVLSNEAVIRDLPLVVVHSLTHHKGVDRAMTAEGWLRCREALTQAHLPSGAPIRLVILEDDAARALLDRAGPQDLIVVGTRGQGHLAGLLPGSARRQMLEEMNCDVMVVQPALTAAPPATSELTDLVVRS